MAVPTTLRTWAKRRSRPGSASWRDAASSVCRMMPRQRGCGRDRPHPNLHPPLRGECCLDLVWSERHAPNTDPSRIKHGVSNSCCKRAHGRLTRAGRLNVRAIDQDYIDLCRCVFDIKDRVSLPIDARDRLVIKMNLLPESATETLDDVALDCLDQAIRIYNQATVMGDCKLTRKDPSTLPIDVDLRHNSNASAVALSVCDTSPAHIVASLIASWRRPALPARTFGCRLDNSNITWVSDVADPKLHRINPDRGCDLIHEGFARKVDLWSNRITKVRRAQWRGPIKQRRYGLPPGAFRSKLVRLGRHAERRLRFQAHARELPGKSVLRAALVAKPRLL